MTRTLLFLSACRLLLPQQAGSQAISDSAGIRILRYAPLAASELALRAPAISIRDGECEMNGIVSVVVQRTGEIVIANAGNHEICTYDGQGKFLRKFGRVGDGPGEFRRIASADLARADSILVIDQSAHRATVFGPTGRVGRSFNIASPDTGLGSHVATISLNDGSVLSGFSEFRRGAPRPEAVMFRQRLFHMKADGSAPIAVGSFPIGEHFIQQAPPERGGAAYWSLVFGREFSAAPRGDGFVGGDGSAFDIREYAADGRLRAIHRLARERHPITAAEIASYSEVTLNAVTPRDRPTEERRIKEMPYPTHYPAYRRILTDDVQRIWIEAYPPQGSLSRRWTLIDPANQKTREVSFPDRFRLLAVRGGRACGVGRDDVDLETVHCFQVIQ